MAKPKGKPKKKVHHFKYRNDIRPRARTAPADKEVHKKKPFLEGRETLVTLIGGAAATVGCAALARFNVMPVWAATGLVSGIGGTAAAVAASPAFKAAGRGALVAAGAQFGLSMLDGHYQKLAVREPANDNKPAEKKRANAEHLPPGALEAAYERARRRVAMAEAASQMAA